MHTPHEAQEKLVPTFSPKEVVRMIKTIKEWGTEEDKFIALVMKNGTSNP